jgi:dephospho-CoA kinase
MDVTGLTGHSGSGKTTVAKIMSELGFYHINCDAIVHDIVYKDPVVLDKISKAFGSEYVTDGVLNRRLLGNLIFADRKEYDKLMELIKKDIINTIQNEIKNHSNKHILLDAPTLFEFGMQGVCNRIIGVISNNAIERICQRDNLTRSQAQNRLKNQQTHDFYKKNCDIIIENDFDIAILQNKVKEIANSILKG